MDKVHPHRPTDFLKYKGTKFEKYVLPIIPVGVTLTELSKIPPANLGKIPGKWKGDYSGKDEWTGFDGWQTYYQSANSVSLERYQRWQEKTGLEIAMGFNSLVLLGFDADTDSPEIAQWMRLAIEGVVGPTTMVRRREGAIRFVMCYRRDEHTLPFSKMRFVGVDKDDNKHLLEILGSSHQWVAEGPHAKGAMHYWENEAPVHEMWDQIPIIDHVKASTIKRTLDETCGMVGLEVRSSLSVTTSSDRESAVSITSVTSPHIEDNRERLTKAIQHIDLDHQSPAMDYDAFINLLRAICASVMGDLNYFTEVVWPWACTQKEARGQGPRTEEQGIEWLETRWKSFTDSHLGPDHVYWWAARCGYTEAMQESKDEKAQELFDAITDPMDDADSSGGGQTAGTGNGGAAGGNGSGSSGPLPFTFTDTAVANTFVSFHPEYRFTSDQGWLVYHDGVYVPTKMVRSDIADICAAVGAPFRAQGSQQAQIDMMMNNQKKHANVETRLRYHRAVHADPAAFDADPWLLNTPGGVVDLRTGAQTDHAGQLMRQQTLVTPDLRAKLYGYETFAPRFMAYLEFIADGRDFVIPFLRRWGASSLVGDVFDQYLLFIHGLPGTGKSTFSDILNRLAHTYSKPVSKGFFMKSLDKRTFELYQTRGKRALFADETPKGASWDEILVNSMLGGTVLSAEGKGRDFVDFRNVATLTVTGNHRPAFITHSEESGIDRRLLILEVNKKIAEHMADNTKFAAEVVAEEGPAILMWLVEETVRGWETLTRTGGSFMGALAKPLLLEAKSYRVQSNPYIEWIEDQMALDPDGDVDAKEAITWYRRFREEECQVKQRYQESRPDFRNGLEAAGRLLGHRIQYERRSAGPLKGRYVFSGLRARHDADNGIDPSAKVVDLFTRREPERMVSNDRDQPTG